jgi:hypothetical protein
MKSGTAFSAHLGGLITGVLFGLFMKSDETVFETSEKRVGGAKKRFVILNANGTEPEAPSKLKMEPSLQPSYSLFEQGLSDLHKGDIQNATFKMSAGIDQLFANPMENKVEIDQKIKKFIAVSSQLSIDSNTVYQWGKKLLEINLPIQAVHCFDLVSKTTRISYLFLNSLLYASHTRIKQQYQIEHAIKSLQYLIGKFPQEMQAREAEKILTLLNK